ncbi:YggT family protein [Campylobacter sp. RM9344]|uniref:YggT family protein n=1 Tax=Campylobacter californiensis TaxID=1032243 RepID=A0AAW3ZTN9_9BACT|nr:MULTISPECIES: YggT family protein [unclassified Campylobacter]MBE2984714.1 YggT family protein [Campylobacter sp. RM6883]MBE2986904.1 YggT family protein [Campylobacter sp. RM12919]MBE2987808.1 YggT family protein [Campylobacter sp. RM12920]MBE2994630.1 YggT family protein [Campylobacter sp. RM6913]MBE3029156.1 YggT family protein [Campylobacter sp. RM9344]
MIVSTFISAIATILHTVINIYIWVIIAAAIVSWVRPDPYNQIVQLLYRVTEPAYAFVRRFIPTVFGGIDIAPIIILLALQFLDLFLVRLLLEFASSI